jgi:hypothetical protein
MFTILLAFAFVFFAIGTFRGSQPPTALWYSRFNFVSAGLAAWVLSEFLSHWPK